MLHCKILPCRFVALLVLTICCFSPPSIAAAQDLFDDAFQRFDDEGKPIQAAKPAPQPKPREARPRRVLGDRVAQRENAANGSKQNAEGKKASNKELLDAFYEEMEALAEGNDEFSKIAKSVQAELKGEFKENEQALAKLSARELADIGASGMLDRQKVIAQLYIELRSRTTSSDSRKKYELQRKISEQFRQFRSKHPDAARDPNFRRKEQEITSKLHRRQYGQNNQTMIATMEELAGGPLTRPKFQSTRVHPGEQAGAIQQNRKVMRKMLKLKWDGPNLTLDRQHWDSAFAGRDVDDIRVEVNDLLRSAGAKKTGESEEVVRRRQFAARANQPQQQHPNIARLFDELRGVATNSSYTRSYPLTFTNGTVQARLRVDSKSLEFVFEEKNDPARFLRLNETEEGLQIMLVGEKMVHRFGQNSKDGKLTAVEIVGDQVISLAAKNFADLYRQHPRFVEDRFFALLDHLGIVAPASRFDTRIVHRVIEYLKMDRDKLKQEVDGLIEQLDAKRFTSREAAYEKLRDGLDEYYDLLYTRKSDKTLSAEVKARVGKLLTLSEMGSASHYDTVISALGLVDDLEYLQELRDVSDAAAQAVLDKRISYLLTQ